MPWNNQNGGGGWKGGGGGPWGQGPQGGGGPGGGQQPDLEELLKRSQDKFKQALPGGGGSGLLWLLAIVGLLLFWGFQSFHTIDAQEQGIVTQFGKYNRTLGAGLKIILWPVEEIEKVQSKTVRSETFGDQASFNTSVGSDRLMLAGDRNLVEIKFTVFWLVKDAKKYVFNVEDPSNLVRGVSESAMREIVGLSAAEDVRINNRKKVENEVLQLIQKTLDVYDAGILVREVKLEEADPPKEVAKAFEEVQSAEQKKVRLIREGERYQNEKLGTAKGKAARIVADAEGYRAKIVAEAEGEAQRFTSVYEEYSKAKDVTRKRLFFETMEKVLGKSNKVIIEKNGAGVVPYLPLPEIQKRSSANRGGQ